MRSLAVLMYVNLKQRIRAAISLPHMLAFSVGYMSLECSSTPVGFEFPKRKNNMCDNGGCELFVLAYIRTGTRQWRHLALRLYKLGEHLKRNTDITHEDISHITRNRLKASQVGCSSALHRRTFERSNGRSDERTAERSDEQLEPQNNVHG